jgi:hypothetical protein
MARNGVDPWGFLSGVRNGLQPTNAALMRTIAIQTPGFGGNFESGSTDVPKTDGRQSSSTAGLLG